MPRARGARRRDGRGLQEEAGPAAQGEGRGDRPPAEGGGGTSSQTPHAREPQCPAERPEPSSRLRPAPPVEVPRGSEEAGRTARPRGHHAGPSTGRRTHRADGERVSEVPVPLPTTQRHRDEAGDRDRAPSEGHRGHPSGLRVPRLRRGDSSHPSRRARTLRVRPAAPDRHRPREDRGAPTVPQARGAVGEGRNPELSGDPAGGALGG
jgi:hypothetical protein